MRWDIGFCKKTLYVLLVLLILLCADSTYTTLILKVDELTGTNLVNVTVDCIGIILCLILFGTICLDKRIEKTSFYMLLIIFLVGLILYCDSTNWAIDGDTEFETANLLANTGLFVIILLIIFVYWLMVCQDLKIDAKTHRYLNAFMILEMAMGISNAILNIETGWIFTIEDGFYTRGDYILISNLPAALMFLTSMFVMLKFEESSRRKLASIAITITPLVATAIQTMYYGLSLLYISLIIAVLIAYGNYYVTRGIDLTKREAELKEEQFATMYSQLQPHFLYNALTSIMAINGNPPETVEAISDFGKYLRGNIDTASLKHAIPIKKELQHVEVYTALEKMRFKNKLNIIFDIRDEKFFVPPLSVQIMVENSIKHGISVREEGGTVRISTFCDDKNHYVTVEDNGVGFDITVPLDDERTHIGIDSARRRTKRMVNGELRIESTTGVGTSCTLIIPRNRDHQDSVRRS